MKSVTIKCKIRSALKRLVESLLASNLSFWRKRDRFHLTGICLNKLKHKGGIMLDLEGILYL